MDCADLLVRYAQMLHLTQQMREAAVQSDWDRLTEFGVDRAALVDSLAIDENGCDWSPAGQEKKSEMIRSMLEADEAIKNLTLAWMGELQEILGSIDTEKKLNKAYNTP